MIFLDQESRVRLRARVRVRVRARARARVTVNPYLLPLDQESSDVKCIVSCWIRRQPEAEP